MVELICLLILIVVLFSACVFAFSRTKFSDNFGNTLFIAISLVFIVFSFVFKPQPFIRWDLIEHFKVIDMMRIGGRDYVIKESLYSDLFVYNYFAYFISLLPDNLKNLLSTIPLTIDFFVVGYIYKKIFSEYLPNSKEQVKILSIIMWLFTFGIKLAITGIRCSLAVSLVALAIYMEMIQKKHRIFSIVLYLCAVFIHNFALVAIAVRLIAKIKKPFLIMLFSFGISFMVEPFAEYIVKKTKNEYLLFSFRRVLDTLDKYDFKTAFDSFEESTLIIYLCFVFFAIYVFGASLNVKRKYSDSYAQSVADFTGTVGAVALGLSFNYLYLERFMYLLSFALLMVVPLHNRNEKQINVENILLIPVGLFVFFFNDIYVFMVNYIGEYFLATG